MAAPYVDSTPYWKALAGGRLALQYCERAGRFQHYPRPVSAYTGRASLAWREVSGRGTLYSYTIVPSADAPTCIGLVALEEGVRILAKLVGCSPDDLAIGCRVLLSPQTVEGVAYAAFRLAGNDG